MPRGLRCFVEGGIYHEYNRFSEGATLRNHSLLRAAAEICRSR